MWRSADTALPRSEWPSTRTSPSSAANRPVSTWNRVDLPAPFGPSSATKAPGATENDSAFKAMRLP